MSHGKQDKTKPNPEVPVFVLDVFFSVRLTLKRKQSSQQNLYACLFSGYILSFLSCPFWDCFLVLNKTVSIFAVLPQAWKGDIASARVSN